MNNTKNLRERVPNHTHAWRGAWSRPMLMDEDCMHPFTVARMTNHNVRGVDDILPDSEIYRDNGAELKP